MFLLDNEMCVIVQFNLTEVLLHVKPLHAMPCKVSLVPVGPVGGGGGDRVLPSSSIHFMVKSWSLSMEHMSLTSPYRPSYEMDGSKWVIMMSLQRNREA